MVIVLGAGLAGLSAALHLAERGIPVTLCERHPRYLGGRTQQRDPYRFEHAGTEYEHSLDHGQHCMWFQYNNMRALMTRLGILETATRACEYTCYVVDDGEDVQRLTPFDVHPDRVPPTLAHFFVHLGDATRARGWGVADSVRFMRAVPRLLATYGFSHDQHYDDWDGFSVAELFAWIGLPAQLDMILKSLCKASTFHPHTEISASWALSMMESTMIAHPADHKMWCFRGNLGTHLIDPIADAARRHGVKIIKNARAVGVERSGGEISAVFVEPTNPATRGAEMLDEPVRLPCDAVVSAVDIPGFQAAIVPDLADRPEILAAANLEAVGNATIRVVTSERVGADEPWLGLFAGKFHFLDAYFLLSRYQDEFMAWPGEVIELHSYFASREIEAAPPAVVRAAIEREVVRAWPALAGKIVHIEYFVNDRTFDKQAVGHGKYQPGIRTSVPNLFLCGSWVKVDTAIHDMEKAVTTGIRAASCVLERLGATPITTRPLRPKTRLQNVMARMLRGLPRPPAVIERERRRTS
jgi:isorenieratene synthase